MTAESFLVHIQDRIRDCNFTVETLASELNRSSSYIREFVNINFNTNPRFLIETVRLTTGIKLMTSCNDCLYSFISRIGYSNPKTFRQVCKRRLNMSPNELKEKLNNDQIDCETIISQLWEFLKETKIIIFDFNC
jgi:YesN/AraC family two-component response regulator